DHHRAVFTLAGAPGRLAPAVLEGAREAVARIDVSTHAGAHPRVGAVDVAPIVHLDDATRGAACAEALVLGDLLGRELDLPVLLYGALAGWRSWPPGRRSLPSTSSSRRPRPSRRQRPSPPAFGRAARRGCPECAPSGSSSPRGVSPRSRPTWRTPRPRGSSRSWRRCGHTPRWRRWSWSGSRRPWPSRASPTTCPSPTTTRPTT